MARVYKNNSEIHARDSLHSFLGYIKHCSGYKTTISLLKSIVFAFRLGGKVKKGVRMKNMR
jgi:hypothetical protein